LRIQTSSLLVSCVLTMNKENGIWILVGIGNDHMEMFDTVLVRDKERIPGFHDCVPNSFS
jgi:hypothetical protein